MACYVLSQMIVMRSLLQQGKDLCHWKQETAWHAGYVYS